MQEWRVTKYNPQLRDSLGRYQVNEWSGASDIGETFDGKELTIDEYLHMEDLYIQSVNWFLRESDVQSLQIMGLESQKEYGPAVKRYKLGDLLTENSRHADQMWVGGTDLENVCRLNLRSLIWCKLELSNEFFVHFGYDYYMYIGSKCPCQEAIQKTQEVGLYVEPFLSPYK